jgi:Carboxypeptidase regulatory-like domain
MRWVLRSLERSSRHELEGGAVRGGRPRLRVAVALVAMALAMLGATGVAQASGTASVAGTVTNREHKAIEGIEVAVFESEGAKVGETTTASNGTYTITPISEGKDTVVFSDKTKTYLSKTVAVNVEEGKTAPASAELIKAGSIAGQVTSASSGAELSGVQVEIVGPEGSGEDFYHVTTEANGRYRLANLAPGRYEITFTYPNSEYLSQTISISLVEGETHTVSGIKLSEGGKISGTVTNTYTHAGLEKIAVYAYVPGQGEGFARTNSKGEYTITGLSSGAYDVQYAWEYSEAEEKEFEKAPLYVPKYITEYYNNQTSAGSANTVSVSEGSTSSGINVAMTPSAPHNTAAPGIAGTALVGDALTCSNGSWTGEGLLSVQSGWPLTTPFGYQWLREGSAISGATLASYVVQSADEGHGLACEVTATNAAGHEASKSSSVTVPVAVVADLSSRLVFVKDTAKASIACANAACAGTAELTARVRARHGRQKTVVIAKGSYSLVAGSHGTVALRLTGPGAKAMLAARHRRIAGKLTISVSGGTTIGHTVEAELAKR